jgi:signal transduction histidine kinase
MMMAVRMTSDALRRIFPGNSEMAEKLREIDWNASSIGSPDSWCGSLRTAIAICLMSNQPMQVAWGAEHTAIFNDAWARHLDLEPHVSAPAHSGQNEIDRVLREGEAISVGGFTYAPIFDDRDIVVGVVCMPDADNEHPEERPNQRAKDDFLALFGHELRNPLSALFTTLQVVARMHPGPEVALMDRAVRHLTRLVDDLLDVSRLNRGNLALHPTRTELANVVDTALAQLESKLAERSTRVFVSVPRTGFELECDPARIAQVLANVIDNASKFSEPGSQVAVEATRTPDRARIIVRDHGAGIEAGRLARVFEPFQDRSSSTTGLGLGLAIARNLVELHNGTIQLNSVVGTGTECVIELPMDAEVVATPPPVEKRATRKRVLLVEDNHDTAVALQKALESLGYLVAIAHNGPVALTVARSFQPDVALLDIGLPVMDGWELARRLRDLKVATRQLHFIAVTARDQDSDKQRSADAGFADHLVKPIDLVKLERVVENLPD